MTCKKQFYHFFYCNESTCAVMTSQLKCKSGRLTDIFSNMVKSVNSVSILKSFKDILYKIKSSNIDSKLGSNSFS